ncbi:M20 family metallopeptidase [Intrasporangium sp.]|uniref:M20 metallopeptidase family protein n=1 Tax=Intrasporangium sp. TaxID=1925024 RepID=UPI0032218E74
MSTPATTTLMTPSPELVEQMVAMRHDLHRNPELGTELPRTQAAVLERIGDLPDLEVVAGTRQSSVTAVLRGGGPVSGQRPLVLLRGDMDALPVTEDTGLPYSSQVPGRMHACGHDVHTAALWGALVMLNAHRAELLCDVVFMFQPAEEASVGARWMIEDGVLDAAGRRPDAAFGLHVFSGMLPHGQFATRPGVFMAGCDDMRAVVTGQGGHGSSPHLALDPVPVACEITLALQTHVNRRYSGFEPIVLTVGRIAAGTDSAIIPATAEIDLTIRTFSEAAKARAVEEVPRLIEGIAAAHGLSAEVSCPPDYPVTVNDPAETAYLVETITECLGADAVTERDEPLAGSEDFSWVLREVPGAFVMLGAGIPGHPEETNHSPRATFDDAMLPRAATTLAMLAWRRGR